MGIRVAWRGCPVVWHTRVAWLPHPAQSHLLVLVQKQHEQQQQQDHDGHTGDKHWCEEGLLRGLYAGSWKGRDRGVSGRGGLCGPLAPTENTPVLCLEHSQYSINARLSKVSSHLEAPRASGSLPADPPYPGAGRTDPPALFLPGPKPGRSHSLLWLESHSTTPARPGAPPQQPVLTPWLAHTPGDGAHHHTSG